MFQKIITTLFVSTLGLMSFSANAAIEKGDQSITVYGSVTSTDTTDTIVAALSFGEFVTDVIEVQGTLILAGDSPKVGDSTTMSIVGLNGNYYFPTGGDLIPYVGAGFTSVSFESGGVTGTETGTNIQAGIKQFISETVAMQYQFQSVSTDYEDSTILSVGVSVFLD